MYIIIETRKKDDKRVFLYRIVMDAFEKAPVNSGEIREYVYGSLKHIPHRMADIPQGRLPAKAREDE